MGLVASQARLLMSYARKSDVEYQCQTICGRRMMLAYQTQEIAKQYTDALSNTVLVDPATANDVGAPTRLYTEDDAIASAIYEAQTAVLQAEDKRLEMDLKNLETQQKAISTEIDSIQKVIEKNIEKSFKVFNS